MQYVNDDMDEVFRKAAENYPLDTSTKDWNKVLSALQNPDVEEKLVRKNDKGKFLWLLLLLPFGLICNHYYNGKSYETEKQTVQKENPAPANTQSSASVQNKTIDNNKPSDLN